MPEVIGQTIIKGTEPKIISDEEAERRRAAQRLAEQPKDDITYANLPVVKFPIKFKIKGRDDFTGDVGGVRFENGISVQFHSWRRVNHLAAAFAPCIDAKTGLTISPLYENRTYMAANKMWNYGQPLPEHCKDETPLPTAEVFPPKSPAVVEIVETPASNPDPEKVARVKAAIAHLRPGHKDDWTADGKPDANRLADIINEKVFVNERDEAWSQFKTSGAEFEGNAFAVSIPGDDIEAVLTAVGQYKGAAYLRQECRRRGLNEPRTLKDIIKTLIEAGITANEARTL